MSALPPKADLLGRHEKRLLMTLSGHLLNRRHAPQQHAGNHHVHNVERDGGDDGGVVGTGEVVKRAGHPAAKRHADHREKQYGSNPLARAARVEISSDDDHVGRHDAALGKPEKGGDEIESR